MIRWIHLLLLVLSIAICAGSATAQEKQAKKKLLLLGQKPDGHPRATHEYMAGVRLLAKCLKDVPNLEVVVVQADDPWEEGPDLLRDADGVVLFVSEGGKWIHNDPRRLEAFAQLAAKGGGLACLHWGMGAKEARFIDGYLKLFGGCHGGPDRKYKVVEGTVQIAEPKHPIATGIGDFRIREEFYYRLKFINSQQTVKPILKAKIDDQLETVCWAWQRPDGGRSFGYSGGHFHENWSRVEYRRLFAQGILWSLKLPVPKDGLPVKVSKDDLLIKRK